LPHASRAQLQQLLNRDSLSQPKVLIVEDCKCDSVLIKHIIDDYFPLTLIDQVETKGEALKRLQSNTYDIVLLDLNLPDTIGLMDIGEIRGQCPNTPLIIITGGCNDSAKQAAKKYNATGIFDKKELIAKAFPQIMEEAVDNVIHF